MKNILVGCTSSDLFNKQVAVGGEVFLYGKNKSVNACKTLAEAKIDGNNNHTVSILMDRVNVTVPLDFIRIGIQPNKN